MTINLTSTAGVRQWVHCGPVDWGGVHGGEQL